ncbi:MAG TPA: glycine cleavage system aminomethyltransferase GcvT [Candidatus Atribacteria bacterium]|nr:glycine cleavage system aminomethyltransferase GcvT [Candidatus Atribacteria bacterium]HQE25045.1 glycine cleavage system aminomethyltransferase GcvT [Candidatus Atribacteria bacterium]
MTLRELPLSDFHRSCGARMGMFCGWEMPLYYRSIREEYFACINSCGLFDISHLGKFFLRGREVVPFLDYATCRRVSEVREGRGKYTFFLNWRGGIVDGVTLFRKSEEEWLLISNAGARERLLQWLNHLIKSNRWEVEIEDVTEKKLLFALQGPQAMEVVEELFQVPGANWPKFSFRQCAHGFQITHLAFSREDGFEIMGDVSLSLELWEKLVREVEGRGGALCGLGARDLLRFEATFPLYGQEIDETTTPLELGREDLVDWEKADFIGKKPLLLEKREGSKKRLVGLEILGRRIPRYGYPIYTEEGIPCGYITSGNYSFLWHKVLALGFISSISGEKGDTLLVAAPRTRLEARITSLPFMKGGC